MLTAAGLQIPTISEIIARFVQEQRADIDPLLDVDAESPVGQLNGIVADEARRAYEAIEVAYHAIDPDAAERAELEMVSAITGTFRAAATRSRFAGTRKIEVELDASVTLAAGATCEVTGAPTTRFRTTEAITSTTAGWYEVEAECTTTGPIDVAPMTLTTITTPVAGWLAVRNPTSPIVGENADDDEALRDRRERELRALGSSSTDAISARVLAIDVDGTRPVISCTCFENTSSNTDPFGVPGHSIEVLVWDGIAQVADDDTIAQTIWDAKPGGSGTFGSASGTAVDRNGKPQIVRFTRPTQREVGVEVEVSVVRGFAGEAEIQEAAADAIDAIPPGAPDTEGEVKWSSILRAILSVPGVVSVDVIAIGFAGQPAGSPFTNLTLGRRDKPIGNPAGVEVTASEVSS